MDAIRAVRDKTLAALERDTKELRVAQREVEARLVAGELVETDEIIEVVGREGRSGVEALLARAEQKRELSDALEQLKGWAEAEERTRQASMIEAEARRRHKAAIKKAEAELTAVRSEWRTALSHQRSLEETLRRLSVKDLPDVLRRARQPYNEARTARDRAQTAFDKARDGGDEAELRRLRGALGLSTRHVNEEAQRFAERCDQALEEHVHGS